MRADESIDYGYVGLPLYDELIDYINQLRYERLMEKARRYRAESNNELCVKFYWDITEYKPTNEIIEQLSRIAEAYEARAKRIKEGK